MPGLVSRPFLCNIYDTEPSTIWGAPGTQQERNYMTMTKVWELGGPCFKCRVCSSLAVRFGEQNVRPLLTASRWRHVQTRQTRHQILWVTRATKRLPPNRQKALVNTDVPLGYKGLENKKRSKGLSSSLRPGKRPCAKWKVDTNRGAPSEAGEDLSGSSRLTPWDHSSTSVSVFTPWLIQLKHTYRQPSSSDAGNVIDMRNSDVSSSAPYKDTDDADGG